MTKTPTLFLSHGGPTVVIDDAPVRDYLRSLASHVGRPKAIVIMSAHFETEGVAVVTDPTPGMIYDFRGFPQELYEMVYPAPGAPALAARVMDMLAAAGLDPSAVPSRGYDHGVWTPLILAYPKADIPIVQVSIDPHRDAAWHYRIGQALAPLREDGVLLIGSGHITHNLRAFFQVMRQGTNPDPALIDKVRSFTGWIAERLAEGDAEALLDWKSKAPAATDNHPTDDHFLPIFFALGAAGDHPKAERAHASAAFGFFANDSYLFH